MRMFKNKFVQNDNNIVLSKKINYRGRERFKDFLCVLPALLFFAVFIYYPIVSLFNISFTDWNLIRDGYEYVGLKNYKWLFAGSGFNIWLASLSVTFIYTMWEVGITIVCGLALACLFNNNSKAFGAMRAVVFMPKYIGISTSGIVFMWILSEDYGILNYILTQLGLEAQPWLNGEDTALFGVLMLTMWRVVGYSMMLYLSAMRGISQDFYEAASLDGANAVQKFFKITLPLLSPMTLFIFVTTFIASMKVFQSIDVMTSGGPYNATNVMVYWIYDLAFVQFRVDRAAVVSCIFFFILLICTAATMKFTNKNVHYS